MSLMTAHQTVAATTQLSIPIRAGRQAKSQIRGSSAAVAMPPPNCQSMPGLYLMMNCAPMTHLSPLHQMRCHRLPPLNTCFRTQLPAVSLQARAGTICRLSLTWSLQQLQPKIVVGERVKYHYFLSMGYCFTTSPCTNRYSVYQSIIQYFKRFRRYEPELQPPSPFTEDTAAMQQQQLQALGGFSTSDLFPRLIS